MRRALRYRYVLFAALAGFSGLEMCLANLHRLTEFYFFVYGGEVLAGTMPGYAGSPLHIYAGHPELQIGPIPLAVNAAMARLPMDVQQFLWSALIFGLSLVSVRAVERLRWHLGRPAPPARALFDGVAVVGAFSALAWFSHLDDAIALTGIVLAAAAVAARRPWMAAVVLGVGASAKPWAVVAAPLLLALPRHQWVRAGAVFVATAVAPWLPFVIAYPHTVGALSFLPYLVSPYSGLTAFGFHAGALAPKPMHVMQLSLGVLLGTLAVHKGKWLAVPLLALSTRMLLEPVFWLYYGAAPILAAVIWETTRDRSVPWWVLATGGIEIGLIFVEAPPTVIAVSQTALAISVVLLVFGRPLSFRRVRRDASASHGLSLTGSSVVDSAA